MDITQIAKNILFICFIIFGINTLVLSQKTPLCPFINVADYGFSPDSSGVSNSQALQKAVEEGGSIYIDKPGTYKIAGTVYLPGNTSLFFGNNVFIKKVDEIGIFTHVFLNKGALTRQYDENIVIDGLQLFVNNVDKRIGNIYGLRGHLAFFYVKDLKIERFRCIDLAHKQYCIQICNFEDISLNDIVIKGEKDGIHLGRGKRFSITNCKFQTVDDAIALNAWDWVSSNPEVGWIEDGIIENCYDLKDGKKPIAFFCRLLAGSWKSWEKGMEVQLSDIVISNDRIYRVVKIKEGKFLKSYSKPGHERGTLEMDGISWLVTQKDTIHQAGVRNVTFRDIFLEKPRTAFSFHFDRGTHRSYYPGSEVPLQEKFLFENIRVMHTEDTKLISVKTPVDIITVNNSIIRKNRIVFVGSELINDFFSTKINLAGTIFCEKDDFTLLENFVDNKIIHFKTSNSTAFTDPFKVEIIGGNGKLYVDSDLNGLYMKH